MNRTDHSYKSVLQVFLIWMLLVFSTGETLQAMESPLIIILSSHDSEQYLQVIEGFEQQLGQLIPGAEFIRYFLLEAEEANNQTVEEINGSKPELLLTLGSKATTTGINSIPDVPLVAAMILNEKILKQSDRATGVLLSHPPQVHMQWLRRFFPDLGRAALLYNPEENSQLVAEMIKTAEEYGVQIEAIPVPSVKELPAALKSLGRNSDMLLGIPDKTVYSAKTAKAVLLSTYRNRIPFAALSSSWVKAGALYALCWNFQDLGRQCGVSAERILSGTPVADIITATPEKVCYEINLRTAEHLRLRLEPALIKGAAMVHE